jgi:soluble lytic murein transglycosylase-like protein
MNNVVLTAAVLALATLWPMSAAAQIYAWRDANGTLVLSDRQLDTPIAVYEVEGAPEIRTTRGVDEGVRTRTGAYEPLIQEHAQRHSLRPELVRAVIQVESGFNARALSPKGAMGLMQLMPATARDLGVLDAYDPEDNIRGGTRYLRLLLDKYNGDERLALAAYNAGPGAVDTYGRRVPPYRETVNYVQRVGSRAGAGSSPDAGSASASRLVIYKTIELVDGRAVPRYSGQRPTAGTFEIVRR